jgi:hypothetical protein
MIKHRSINQNTDILLLSGIRTGDYLTLIGVLVIPNVSPFLPIS